MICPRCAQSGKMKAEIYEGVEIDRCSQCLGVWLYDKEIVLP